MTWRMLYKMGDTDLPFLLVMAAGDYMYQRYEYYKSFGMTKKEVKDEHKQTEGDLLPVRSRIRRVQRENGDADDEPGPPGRCGDHQPNPDCGGLAL